MTNDKGQKIKDKRQKTKDKRQFQHFFHIIEIEIFMVIVLPIQLSSDSSVVIQLPLENQKN